MKTDTFSLDFELKRIALGVQYDGTPWQGWQTQLSGNTVQDRLQAALKKFARTEITTTCAGRTDTGVHALEQVVHFDTALERESFSWVRGLNAYLPPSIAVRWATEVVHDPAAEFHAREFHARFSARSRTYHYALYNHPVRSPLLAGKVGWVYRPLALESMQVAAAYLIGHHDFSAFRSADCQAKSPLKKMHEIRIERRGDLIIFTIHASAFLHHMVRNIIGSLIYAGIGRHPPEWMKSVLIGRDRNLAAPTFMPDGLYLAKVDYDTKWGLPQEKVTALPWLTAGG